MASTCICNLELFHKKSNTTGATIGAETVYPSGAPGFAPGFQ